LRFHFLRIFLMGDVKAILAKIGPDFSKHWKYH
jgi:hypothetical protein